MSETEDMPALSDVTDVLPALKPVNDVPSIETLSEPLIKVPTEPVLPKEVLPEPVVEPVAAPVVQASANRFEDVLHSCVRTRYSAKNSNSIPLCHNALENVTVSDVLLYQNDSPDLFARMESQLASVFSTLHANDDYRLVGLYFSLLAQDINLLDLSAGQLAHGTSGEVAQRLAAVMQQSLRVREKRQFVLPHWVIGTLCLLGFLCFVSLCVIGGVVHHFMKKAK
jgi:hypothetical protein